MTHTQEVKSSIFGAVLTMVYNFNLLFIGDIFKALVLGMVGALGGWLMNRILKKFSK